MTKTTLVKAIAEAERFLEKARKAEVLPVDKWDQINNGWAHQHIAACKRASMDCSRALADLRQNR